MIEPTPAIPAIPAISGVFLTPSERVELHDWLDWYTGGRADAAVFARAARAVAAEHPGRRRVREVLELEFRVER